MLSNAIALMRGGAPNAEVLRATTVAEYLALGAKYSIPLQPPGGLAVSASDTWPPPLDSDTWPPPLDGMLGFN